MIGRKKLFRLEFDLFSYRLVNKSKTTPLYHTTLVTQKISGYMSITARVLLLSIQGNQLCNVNNNNVGQYRFTIDKKNKKYCPLQCTRNTSIVHAKIIDIILSMVKIHWS